MRPSASLATLIFLLAGCADGTTDAGTGLPATTDFPLDIQTTAVRVEPGAAMGFRFINNASSELEYNLCIGGQLERLSPNGWVELPHPLYPCAAFAIPIPGGQTRQDQYAIPDDAPRGTYRFRVGFRSPSDGAGVIRRSNMFEVR